MRGLGASSCLERRVRESLIVRLESDALRSENALHERALRRSWGGALSAVVVDFPIAVLGYECGVSSQCVPEREPFTPELAAGHCQVEVMGLVPLRRPVRRLGERMRVSSMLFVLVPKVAQRLKCGAARFEILDARDHVDNGLGPHARDRG